MCYKELISVLGARCPDIITFWIGLRGWLGRIFRMALVPMSCFFIRGMEGLIDAMVNRTREGWTRRHRIALRVPVEGAVAAHIVCFRIRMGRRRRTVTGVVFPEQDPAFTLGQDLLNVEDVRVAVDKRWFNRFLHCQP